MIGYSIMNGGNTGMKSKVHWLSDGVGGDMRTDTRQGSS
jgi:hypothetical protein